MNPLLPCLLSQNFILKDPQDSQKQLTQATREQGLQPMTGTPYSVDIHPFLSPLDGLPCKTTPLGICCCWC